MKSEPIEKIHRKYHNEWLLIRVTKTDRYDTPLEGILLFHSKNRIEIWEKQYGLEGDLLIDFAGDFVPKDTEVILHGNISF
ncbi:MAG: hypothetical protein ACE5PV_11400 [Candidatus Poribacteria bacterium]